MMLSMASILNAVNVDPGEDEISGTGLIAPVEVVTKLPTVVDVVSSKHVEHLLEIKPSIWVCGQ